MFMLFMLTGFCIYPSFILDFGQDINRHHINSITQQIFRHNTKCQEYSSEEINQGPWSYRASGKKSQVL